MIVDNYIKEMESYERKFLVWSLWEKNLMLFDFCSVYFYMTIDIVLDMIWSVIRSIPLHVHISIGKFLVVDWVYRSCECPPGKMTSLVRLVNSGRSGVI